MGVTLYCRAGVGQLTRENGEVEQKLQRWKPLDSLFLLKILPFNIGFKRPPSWGKRWRRPEVGRSSSTWSSPPGRGSSWCRSWRTSGGRWRIPSLGLYYFWRIKCIIKEETLETMMGRVIHKCLYYSRTSPLLNLLLVFSPTGRWLGKDCLRQMWQEPPRTRPPRLWTTNLVKRGHNLITLCSVMIQDSVVPLLF